MRNIRVFLSSGFLMAAFSAPVLAQGSDIVGPYVGANVGFHTIDDEGTGLDVDGFLLGGFVGYNFATYNQLYFGVEGNFNIGTNAIDSDFGGSAHVGYAFSPTSRAFLRGGYQAVNLDINELVRDLVGDDVFDELQDEFEEEFENVGGDDTEGGALIGVGLEFDIIENGAIRLTVDTIEFDSARVTTGFSFRF
ncbi:MAG: outer membrane beta-barrel protein [Pseudomonadota bacterium]